MMKIFTGMPFSVQVASSCVFIWIEPSPVIRQVGRSGIADGGAHRRRQAEAHRAEAARVDPAPRLGEVEVLRGPHLVLADVGGEDAVAAGRLVERLDHVLRLDLGVRSPRSAAGAARASPRSAPTSPRGARGRRPTARYSAVSRGRMLLRVADDRDVRRDVLGDLGRVDVDVDELGPRRELRQLAGDAVVEAGADRRRSGRPRPSRSWPCACRACRASPATAGAAPGTRRGPSACRSPAAGPTARARSARPRRWR